MTNKIAFALVLTIIAWQPQVGFAREVVPPEFNGRGCRFFQNEDGQGPSAMVPVTTRDESNGLVNYVFYQPSMSSYWNNAISAVKCDHHCSAALYDQEQRAGGEIATPYEDFVSLGGLASNNRTSSLAVFCAR